MTFPRQSSKANAKMTHEVSQMLLHSGHSKQQPCTKKGQLCVYVCTYMHVYMVYQLYMNVDNTYNFR